MLKYNGPIRPNLPTQDSGPSAALLAVPTLLGRMKPGFVRGIGVNTESTREGNNGELTVSHPPPACREGLLSLAGETAGSDGGGGRSQVGVLLG